MKKLTKREKKVLEVCLITMLMISSFIFGMAIKIISLKKNYQSTAVINVDTVSTEMYQAEGGVVIEKRD